MAGDKLYRGVIDAVLEKIRSGQRPVGSRLPTERELAETLVVSRTTVREAMVALEMLGIVEMRRGSGVYVLRLPDTAVVLDALDIGAFELIEARRVVEGELAALAATRITPDDLRALAASLVEMDHPDEATAELADRAFHLVIARATGNGPLAAVSESLWDMRERAPLARTILHRARRLGLASRIEEHRAILRALADRDPLAARATMRAHLDRVIEHLLAMTEHDEIEAARERTVSLRQRLAHDA